MSCIVANLMSVLVASSWICSYFAVKHLPVSLASPVRATGPVWTLLGAVLVLGERHRPGAGEQPGGWRGLAGLPLGDRACGGREQILLRG